MKVFFRTWQKQENTDKHTPLDYDYDYSSKIRRGDTSGKLREIESYIIYIYIYKYI